MSDDQVMKVSDEQLQVLREIQANFDYLTKRYGELHFELKQIDAAMEDLEDRRYAVIQSLQAELGVGTVDLATGEFKPDQE